MNVETRARAAAERLRSATPVDVEAGLSRLRRTRRRRDAGRLAVVCAAVVAITGGTLLAVDRGDDDVSPAEPTGVRNGPIVNAGDREFGATPTLPSRRPYPLWQAADPASRRFLYVSADERRVAIVDESGTVAEVECPTRPCGLGPYPGGVAFGPGADELTFTIDGQFQSPPRAVQIIGYDGELRDEIDVSDPAIPQRSFKLITWSPDRRELAVALDSPLGAGGAEVWAIPGDGGAARLVYRQPAPQERVDDRYVNTPHVVDLAWSPDGSRLGILLANDLQGEEGTPGDPSRPLPRLITVPARGGDTRTLHTFEFRDPHGSVSTNYIRNWAFAWSPDGERLAVTSGGGVAEISSTDGSVLAEHRGFDDYGPLVWLPEQPSDPPDDQ